jgi:large subunit ribosomal protein L10
LLTVVEYFHKFIEGKIVPLSMEDKKAIVSEVAGVAASAYSSIAAEYSGLTVGQMTDLRARARTNGVYLRVVKNTLARRAVEGTEYECMRDGFTGPLILAFSQQDPGSAARLLKDFSKEAEQLKVRMVSIGGELMDASALDRLASLPTREQALSMMLAQMKAPVEKFVRTLAEPHAKLARTIAAVRDQKQAAA